MILNKFNKPDVIIYSKVPIKNIRVTLYTIGRLNEIGKGRDTYDDIINKLCKYYEDGIKYRDE